MRWLSRAIPLTLILSTTAPAEVWTYRTTDEIFVVRDFDADGDQDYLIADRLSGQYLAGITNSSGTVVWGEPVDSGLLGIDDVAVGPITPGASTMEAAFVQAASNRMQITEIATAPFSAPSPVPFFPARIGPSGIALATIENFGSPNLAHPVLVTSLNGSPAYALTSYENIGGATALVEADDDGGGPAAMENLQVYKPSLGGTPSILLFVERGDPNLSNDVLHGITQDPDRGYPSLFTMPGLPAGADFLPADFGGIPLALIYSPGTSLLKSMEIASGSVPDSFLFSAGPVAQLFLLKETSGNAIAAVRADRSGIDVYDMDPGTGPTLRLSIDLAGFPDELVSGVLGGLDTFELATGAATSTGVRTLATQRFNSTGDGSYTPGPRQSLTPFIGGGLGVFSNVVFFSSDPLTTPESERFILRQEATSPWAHSKTAVAGGVRLGNSQFTSPSTGLEDSGSSTVNGVGADVDRALINQEADDISFSFSGGSHGVAIAELHIDPPAGTYRSSVTPEISSSNPNAVIHYRIGPEPWQTGTGRINVGGLNSLSTVEFFAAAPDSDAKSPISMATYTFAITPDEIDSDGDGLPDFVERHLGLDPEASGWDADGDGASDLEEAVAGSDPIDDTSKPAPGATDVNEEATLTLIATPRSMSGIMRGSLSADSPSANGIPSGDVRDTRIRVHNVAGGLLGLGLTKGTGFPSATIENIPLGQSQEFLVASTPANFWIVPLIPGVPISIPRTVGRETIALVPMPIADPRSRAIPEHVPGDANSWINARRNYYDAQVDIPLLQEITPSSTLIALLFERVVSEIATIDRTLGKPTDSVTLTSFRNGEEPSHPDEDASNPSQRLLLPMDTFRALDEPFIKGGSVQDAGFDLREIFEAIRTEVETGGNPEIDALVDLSFNLYAFSAARSGRAPGAYDAPFEVLRQFIQNPGSLPGDPSATEGYASQLKEFDLTPASNAITNIVQRYSLPRELITLVVETPLDGNSFVFLDVKSGEEIALYGSTLEPFELEGNTPTLPGTRLQVEATRLDPLRYDFLPVPTNAHRVISVRFLDLGAPVIVHTDTNGNLLEDSFERFYLPEGSSGPYTDSDGDGFTDLQESLDGTDPGKFSDHPAIRVDLSPPEIQITVDESGQRKLAWEFPSGYAQYFQVDILQSDDLRSLRFHGQSEELSAGSARVETRGDRQFYRLLMRLK